MIKIDGLDKLSKELKDAQKALAEIDGDIGRVSFDPNDPISIEAAITSMETKIDEKVGRYANNSIVAPLIEGMKEQYREGILEQAAEARLKGDDE